MSDKIEILSFDDWARFQGLPLDRDENGLYVNRHTHYARKGWEAKPEKAEIDGLKMANYNLSVMVAEAESYSEYWKYERDKLQKRLDEINNHLEINYDENRDDDSHSYWSGYNQALRELSEILKGGVN